MFTADRRPRTDDRFVNQKMLMFVLGAVLAIAGMVTERQWLVYVALGVLVIGVILRLLAGRSRDDD